MSTTAPGAAVQRPRLASLDRWARLYNIPSHALAAWLLVLVFGIGVGLLRPSLLRPGNIQVMLTLAAVVAIAGLGQGMVVLVGGIDLSIPAVMSASAIAAATVFANGGGLVWSILLGLGLGLVIGVFSGVGVGVLGINPVVMTLSVNAIVAGVSVAVTNGQATPAAPPALSWFMKAQVLGVRPVLVFLVLVAIASVVVSGRTVAGRYLYSVGNSRKVSTLSRVPVRTVVVAVYGMAGVCSALAGLLLTGLAGQSYLGMGDSYLLASVAVVVLGGSSVTGGRGHFLGTLAGAIILSQMQMLLAALSLDAGSQQVVLGLMIVAALVALTRRGGWRKLWSR